MPSPRASTGCSRGSRDGARRFSASASAGQGTVEYAIVLFAFVGIVAGLGTLWHALEAGDVVAHALQSASHHVSSVSPGAFSDVFMY